MVGRHQELTMVRVVVTVESEGVRAELATYARRRGGAPVRTRWRQHVDDARPGQTETSTG